MEINIKEIYDYIRGNKKTAVNPYCKTYKDVGCEVGRVPGHYYEIAQSLRGWSGDTNEFETEDRGMQMPIRFIDKRPDGFCQEGIVNEQILLIIKDRMQVLQDAFPSKENEQVIKHLDKAVRLLMKRQAERYERDVLGKHEI